MFRVLGMYNFGQHSGFSEENHPKIGFDENFKKCNFLHLDSKTETFFGFEGWKKGPISFFQ